MMNFCPRCHTEPSAGNGVCYCTFCNRRRARIQKAFRQCGKTIAVHQMHRAWKHWRRTPELDALYLDPLEEAA